MLRVCFVCMGNICRSPSAEVVMRRLLEERDLAGQVEVESAGTGGWHAGNRIDTRSGAALTARGYDSSSHRARQFSPEWFDRLDLVLAMDSDNLAELRRLASRATDPPPVRLLREYDAASVASGELDVPDPYYDGDEGFERVLDMIEAACRGLLDELVQQL